MKANWLAAAVYLAAGTDAAVPDTLAGVNVSYSSISSHLNFARPQQLFFTHDLFTINATVSQKIKSKSCL